MVSKLAMTGDADVLRKVVAGAVDQIPFYAEKYKTIIGSKTQAVDEFSKIPILYKEEIENMFWEKDRFLSKEFDHEKLIHERTSGSTGTPLLCYKSHTERVALTLTLWKKRKRFDKNIFHNKAACLTPTLSSEPAKKNRVLELPIYDISNRKLNSYFDLLKNFQPDWMYGSAFAIYQFSKWCSDNGKDLQELDLSFVELQGEAIGEKEIETVRKAFDCPVTNQYACIEIWLMAYSCPSGELHINEEDVFLEILNENGDSVENGGVGKIVVTSKVLQAMPFIRYAIGDEGRLVDSSCGCCENSKSLELFGTRKRQELITPDGGKFDGIIFSQILDDICNGPTSTYVNQLRVIQKTQSVLEVYIAPGRVYGDYGGDIRKFYEKRIHKMLHQDFKVSFYDISDFPHKKMKYNVFISELKSGSYND